MDVEKGTRQLKALIEKLERNNRTLRSHPTIEKIERGELSAPQLRHWATQLFIPMLWRAARVFPARIPTAA